MIEINNQQLHISFPEVHPDAKCSISFQRTLRVPDDNNAYSLPAGLGRFPLEHIDDFAHNLSSLWKERGGVLMPMYQAEAMWINFSIDYPMAIKIAAGKINAVTGKSWSNELNADPQDYVVTPDQPWLDGFNVSDGHVRQFVAMPLGEGFSAEEQLTGEAEFGGLQIIAYPMKAELYKRPWPSRLCMTMPDLVTARCAESAAMGLAPGGLIKQEINEDPHGIEAWDMQSSSRCFVHLLNSKQYKQVTAKAPPTKSVTAADYKEAGIPWFDYYSDAPAVSGSSILGGLVGIGAKHQQSSKGALPDNQPIEQGTTVVLKSGGKVVRDGKFQAPGH